MQPYNIEYNSSTQCSTVVVERHTDAKNDQSIWSNVIAADTLAH